MAIITLRGADHLLSNNRSLQPRTLRLCPCASATPPKTCTQVVSDVRSALRRYRDTTRTDPDSPSISETDASTDAAASSTSIPPRRLTVRLPVPSPTYSDDLVRGFDEGEWPGGVRQRFRALRPLVERFLDGYSPEFVGMLESPADGMGVWTACNGDVTVITYVSNATFAPFARLCAGEFGSKVLQPGHTLIVVNPAWTKSSDIGQLWQRDLKAQAAALIDDPSLWVPLYHFEDLRTAAGSVGILWKTYFEPWRLYSAETEREGEEGVLVAENLLLESETKPETVEVIKLLNAAAKEKRENEKANGKTSGWWGGL